MVKRTKTEEKIVSLKIVKPAGFLEKFKAKKAPTIGGVETLLQALPHHKISDANDFVRLHPSEDEYWSPELCFVVVPIHGEKRELLHLIDEEIATTYLHAKKIKRCRLALGAKPYDVFFLCQIPSTNTDNPWNATALSACEKAKTNWVQVSSRKAEGIEGYKTDCSQHADAFPAPNWPSRSLEQLIEVTFRDCAIDADNHPALLRMIGARQNLS